MTLPIFNPEGLPLEAANMPRLVHVTNLVWYDGPLLDVAKDLDTGAAVLVLWLDCNETSNLWGYLWLTPQHQATLLAGKAPVYEMVNEATRVLVFRTEDTTAPLDIREIDRQVLMDACGPQPSAPLEINEVGRAELAAAFTRSYP